MAELNFKLQGWQAVAAAVVLIGFVGFRFVSFKDLTNNTALMTTLDSQLLMEYLPDQAEALRAAYEEGDLKNLEETAESITSTDLNFVSVQGSYPLFDFSTSKDVVVKVAYVLTDATGPSEQKTRYFMLSHNSLGDVWRYKYESSSIGYFLNFL